MNNVVKFSVEIKDIEQLNPSFSKCKIYICHSDLNRNQSILSKELINKKLNTLIGCPIEGLFSKAIDDFTDHGGKVEEDPSSGELKYVITTVPYGFVPESSEIEWENINGKDYLTCTGLLWTSRHPEALKVIEEGRPQSMEISEVEGTFNKQKQFTISDFVFSALTILGNDVDPCFEDAKIMAYSHDEFKREFKLMVDEHKSSLSISFEKEDGKMPKGKKEIAKKFKLTVNQLSEEMSRALSEITYSTTDWYYGEEIEVNKYYLRDFDEQFVYAVDREEDYIDVKIPYTMSGDNVVLDATNSSRIKYVPTDWEGDTAEENDDQPSQSFALKLIEESKKMFEKFKSKLTEKEDALLSLNAKFTSLQEESQKDSGELETLKTYKKEMEDNQRKEMVASTMSKYAKHLTKEEKETFIEKEPTFAKFEDFEKEIKSFVCDKLVVDNKKDNATFSKMGIPPQNENESSDVWERLSNK